MAPTRKNHSTPTDILVARIEKLERHLSQVKNDHVVTVPVYNPSGFPSKAVQGQIAIAHPSSTQSKTAWAHDETNGWWKIGGAGIVFDAINNGGYLDVRASDLIPDDGGVGSSGASDGVYKTSLQVVTDVVDGTHATPALARVVIGFVRNGNLGGGYGDLFLSIPSRGRWRFDRQSSGSANNSRTEILNINYNGALNFTNAANDGGAQIFNCASIQCMGYDLLLGAAGSTFLGGFVGTGPPTSATNYAASVRDFLVDSNGDIWICVASGTPGTWKRVRPYNSGNTTSSGTPTINTDRIDVYELTAQAADITSFTTNLTGTPIRGQRLHITITDNGTARGITWGSKFESSTVTLPTTTVVSTRLDVDFIWNPVTSAWRCLQAV